MRVLPTVLQRIYSNNYTREFYITVKFKQDQTKTKIEQGLLLRGISVLPNMQLRENSALIKFKIEANEYVKAFKLTQ